MKNQNEKCTTGVRLVACLLMIVMWFVAVFFPLVQIDVDTHSVKESPISTTREKYMAYIDFAEEANILRSPDKQDEIKNQFDEYRTVLDGDTVCFRKSLAEMMIHLYSAFKICQDATNIQWFQEHISLEGIALLAEKEYKEINASTLQMAFIMDAVFGEKLFYDLSKTDFLNASLFDYITINTWIVIAILVLIIGMEIWDLIRLIRNMIVLKKTNSGNDNVWTDILKTAKGYMRDQIFLIAACVSLAFVFSRMIQGNEKYQFQVGQTAYITLLTVLLFITVAFFGISNYTVKEKTSNRAYLVMRNVSGIVRPIFFGLGVYGFNLYLQKIQQFGKSWSAIFEFILMTMVFACLLLLMNTIANAFVVVGNARTDRSAEGRGMILLLVLCVVIMMVWEVGMAAGKEFVWSFSVADWVLPMAGIVGLIAWAVNGDRMRKKVATALDKNKKRNTVEHPNAKKVDENADDTLDSAKDTIVNEEGQSQK